MLDFAGRRTEHRRLGGVPVALASEADLVAMMVDDCTRNRAGLLHRAMAVLDVNGQAISLHAKDAGYADALESADIVHADGQFLIWASRMFGGEPIPERTATTDFIHAAAAAAAHHGLSFFLLGGTDEVNRLCAERLAACYPGLRIAGRRHGYFNATDEDAVVGEINSSGADIVWVGLGKPKEQAFILQNRSRLRCAWAVSCGGCFNYVTGHYSRAPLWMQKAGLEWVHRALTGPRYLLWRYLVTTPHALALVAREQIRSRFGGREEHLTGRGG